MNFSRIAVLPVLFATAAGAFGQANYEFTDRARTHRYQLETDIAKERPARTVNPKAVPVFLDLEELPPAGRLASMPAARREARIAAARRPLTPTLHVRLSSERQWTELQATQPESRSDSLVKGWTIVRYKDAWAALDAIQWMSKRGGYTFTPIFARRMAKRQTATLERPVNDPLVEKQWHLHVEQGIRLRGSWDVVTGKGINIAVIDDGLEVAHEDLAANAYPIDGNYHRNFNEGPENDPSPLKVEESHGTACAGLAAARGFNNLGVIGVAPEARLMGLRLIAGDSGDEETAKAFLWQPSDVVTYVSSNSWGPQDDGADQGRLGPLAAEALRKAVTEHRGGLGTVFVFSAGNGREAGDDASYDQFSGNRFAIAVGAVNREGKPSSYSEQGMSVAVSAPGGEMAPPEMIWTTYNSGADALAKLKGDQKTSEAPVNYTDAFNGTSAAAPQVSGAAALMLEHNPNLGYRDVKEILMRTARRDGLSGGDDFVPNGGGFVFSHSFGAGVIDVARALVTAADWTNLGPLRVLSATAEGEAAIPDGEIAGATATLDFTGSSLRVEHVEFTVDVEHGMRGDLGFVLISPSGMVSVADPRPADEGKDFKEFTFTSVRHWGENSSGVWRVRAIDTKGNGTAGAMRKAAVRIYGTER